MRIHGWAVIAAGLALTAPGTAAAASSEPGAAAPTVAVGRSADGRVAYRLAGDRLTVTFGRPLAPRGSGARLDVRSTCGHAVRATDDAGAEVDLGFTTRASRQLHVRGGVRVLRAKLSSDVVAAANRCDVSWRDRSGVRPGPARSSSAVLAPRGQRPAPSVCAAPPGTRSEAESETVLAVSIQHNQESFGSDAHIACRKPDGAWRLYDRGQWTKYHDDRNIATGAGGSWIGWTVLDTTNHQQSCSVARLDLAAPGAVTQRFGVELPGTTCPIPGSPVVAANGAIAWRGSLVKPPYEGGTTEHVLGLTAAGTVVTLATVDSRPGDGSPIAVTDLAISADGATVSWRERGVERSAVLP
jgi:hypothetical protein